MLQTLTAKLKLEVTPEQKEMLRVASLAYRDALNFASAAAFDMGKTYNGTKIQKEVYRERRKTHVFLSVGYKAGRRRYVADQIT